jgi:methylase of polypeptide subunit release factors
MEKIKGSSKSFKSGLEKLGFDGDGALYFTGNTQKLPELEIGFHIETAKFIHKEITAIFLRKQLNGSYKPQVYLFDYTHKGFSEQIENEIADIQRKIWSSGEVPLACFFFNTEIKIIDCTKHLTKELKPEYLADNLRLVDEAHSLYNEQFAVKIKTGIFWEQEEIKGKFDFKNSAYDTLIQNIRKVTEMLSKELKKAPRELINKIIIQSILIKYLEETSDDEGKKLLTEKYFKKYNNSNSFNDVLIKGKFSNLLNDLNKNFNGNVFKWETTEQEQLESLDLSIVAKLLATDKISIDALQLEIGFPDWRYFEFKYIPVELISRLYEEFLGENKKDKGLFYTPSHLAKLLVDECLPLKKYKDFDLANFRILDPACGSGIFLVTAFKRLVQIWRLQHKLDKPNIDDLKKILRNIYGVDKEEQAVMLSSFSLSLALCNELKPIEVINKLKFDDLTKENLVHSDFFVFYNTQKLKYDLVIGNPPYVRGGTKELDDNQTFVSGQIIKVPNNQIALKFLGHSHALLNSGGLQCLLVKSSGLLHNSSSHDFTELIFAKTNVVQILDFTSLARNNTLWDNKNFSVTSKKKSPVEVDTAAIFIRQGQPDYSKNILHVTFRRTKATKDRIVFEIDDYDLHFINRKTAIENKSIWKYNLLGGGRIKNTIEKLESFGKLEDLFSKQDIGEGAGGAKSLPNSAFLGNSIDQNYITSAYLTSFNGKKDKNIYVWPNFLVKKNIDLPFALNRQSIKFSNEIVGFHSKDIELLENLKSYFEKNRELLKFYLICTSGKMLVYKNTACKKEDIIKLPIDFKINWNLELTKFDKNIISDVNNIMQFFLRNGEKSKALQQIRPNKLVPVLLNYGTEFSIALNSVYENKGKRFRLSDVIQLDGTSLIATVFRYDNKDEEPLFHTDFTKLNIDGLTKNEISAHLSVKRIIKLYPQEDTIVFIKPNQYRYWLSLIAYRDADKCFSDLSNAGY